VPDETPASEKVLYAVADSGVATITLNDPDTRNALSPELLGGLIAAFERARDEEAVRCVVLASSHETCWRARWGSRWRAI
jgi:enoyl-CoA hydratase